MMVGFFFYFGCVLLFFLPRKTTYETVSAYSSFYCVETGKLYKHYEDRTL